MIAQQIKDSLGSGRHNIQKVSLLQLLGACASAWRGSGNTLNDVSANFQQNVQFEARLYVQGVGGFSQPQGVVGDVTQANLPQGNAWVQAQYPQDQIIPQEGGWAQAQYPQDQSVSQGGAWAQAQSHERPTAPLLINVQPQLEAVVSGTSVHQTHVQHPQVVGYGGVGVQYVTAQMHAQQVYPQVYQPPLQQGQPLQQWQQQQGGVAWQQQDGAAQQWQAWHQESGVAHQWQQQPQRFLVAAETGVLPAERYRGGKVVVNIRGGSSSSGVVRRSRNYDDVTSTSRVGSGPRTERGPRTSSGHSTSSGRSTSGESSSSRDTESNY